MPNVQEMRAALDSSADPRLGGFPSSAPDWVVQTVYSRMQGEKRSCFDFMEPGLRALYEPRRKTAPVAPRPAPAVSAECREEMQRRVRNAVKLS
jgi:hypothetical protein